MLDVFFNYIVVSNVINYYGSYYFMILTSTYHHHYQITTNTYSILLDITCLQNHTRIWQNHSNLPWFHRFQQSIRKCTKPLFTILLRIKKKSKNWNSIVLKWVITSGFLSKAYEVFSSISRFLSVKIGKMRIETTCDSKDQNLKDSYEWHQSCIETLPYSCRYILYSQKIKSSFNTCE